MKRASNLVLKIAAVAIVVCLFAVPVAPLSRRRKRSNCELGPSLRDTKRPQEWHIHEIVKITVQGTDGFHFSI